jgi:hypothetical protein
MSIFAKIMSSIFGRAQAAEPAPAGASPGATTPGATTPGATTSAAGGGAATAAAGGKAPVDVAAILTDLAAKNKEKLDWRRSIVDLMKLLDLDSSLSARKELAKELGYTGDTGDSAAMNVWLHKQVMRKLAENGGKVPDDLKS